MAFLAKADTPPQHEDATGALSVGDSRVLLEIVIRAFQDGATPETIVQQSSSLTLLSDVYAVVAYYLRHREQTDDYLVQREQRAEETRKRIETQQGDLSDIRSRLLSRRQSRGGIARSRLPSQEDS